jgi:hypothetical protein
LYLVLSTVKQAGLDFCHSSEYFGILLKMVEASSFQKLSSKFHGPGKLDCVFNWSASANKQGKWLFKWPVS